VLGTDKESGEEFAIKILEKKHIVKENKQKYVKTERDILSQCNHPNIVKLFYTFRSETSLYYVLELCENGELLGHLRQLGSIDEECIKFYTAELVNALQYLHTKGIVHRDLKPENVLISLDWHLKLTDFGTAKILGTEKNARSNSFVGTAEYVSPELINSKETCCSSDLWAMGSIIYQMFTNRLPFRGKTEFLTFQKVSNREITYPKNFPPVAKDLIENLLIINPANRIGAREGGYQELKDHPFFEGIDWNNLHKQTPPTLRKLGFTLVYDEDATPPPSPIIAPLNAFPEIIITTQGLPVNQEETVKWVKFLKIDEKVVHGGLIWKRKGLSIKQRQLLLTDTPRLIYIDPKRFLYRGEIPWVDYVRPELKNNADFFIHTPKRKYNLEDTAHKAGQWVEVIQKMVELHPPTPSPSPPTPTPKSPREGFFFRTASRENLRTLSKDNLKAK